MPRLAGQALVGICSLFTSSLPAKEIDDQHPTDADVLLWPETRKAAAGYVNHQIWALVLDVRGLGQAQGPVAFSPALSYPFSAPGSP